VHHFLEHFDGAAGRADGTDDGRHAVGGRRRVDVELAQRLEVRAGERRRQLLDVRALRDERHAARPARHLEQHPAAARPRPRRRRRAGRVLAESARRPAVTEHLRHFFAEEPNDEETQQQRESSDRNRLGERMIFKETSMSNWTRGRVRVVAAAAAAAAPRGSPLDCATRPSTEPASPTRSTDTETNFSAFRANNSAARLIRTTTTTTAAANRLAASVAAAVQQLQLTHARTQAG